MVESLRPGRVAREFSLSRTVSCHPSAVAVWQSARDYGARLRLFRPNARLYLLNVVVAGAAMGVFRLIFNFYILSRGFDEALLGNLVTVNSFTSLLVALPIGYFADVIGPQAVIGPGRRGHGAVESC